MQRFASGEEETATLEAEQREMASLTSRNSQGLRVQQRVRLVRLKSGSTVAACALVYNHFLRGFAVSNNYIAGLKGNPPHISMQRRELW